VDHSQAGTHAEFGDSEWDSRVERAATADVRRMLRTARRRQRGRWLVGAIALVAAGLVAVLLFQIGVFGASTPAAPQTTGNGTAEPAASQAVDPTQPFARSPAANWPDGAAGITLPTPVAVGGYTADQVATATQQVRDVLTVSRLDRRVVVDHNPAPFLDALAPDARRPLEPLFGNGHEAGVQSLVSMAATNTQLLPVPPKVSGTMTVSAGAPGELVVHTNYVFVYAFHTDNPDKIVDVMDILVVVRADVDYIFRTGDYWAKSSWGWWYGKTGGYAYSIACDAYRKGFLAPAFTERTQTEVSGQDRTAYFDPSSPLPAASGCPA
jgi:hypothetical protein